MSAVMLCESIWIERPKYEEAEAHYQRFLAGAVGGSHGLEKKGSSFSPVQEIANARKKIQQTLSMAPTSTMASAGADNRIVRLEEENRELKKVTEELRTALQKLTLRVDQLEKDNKPQGSSQLSENMIVTGVRVCPEDLYKTGHDPVPVSYVVQTGIKPQGSSQPSEKKEKSKKDDDDDFDLFGSDDDESEEEDEVKQARVAQYAAKKAKKPVLVAKSIIILDIKPWDDETDMAAMEKAVRSIECDGLEWQASKILPVAFGITKLQISCKVEDEKCGTDFLEEKVTEIEDLVQSVDVVAFNKL